MSAKKLSQSALMLWVRKLIEAKRVVAPQARTEHFAYDLLSRAEDLRLDHDVTILPPRKYLMPPSEVLLRFTRKDGYTSVIEHEPLVLFGVHPYDVAAIAHADRYFLQDKPDFHYQARRKSITIVACDVQNGSENVFAACVGAATVSDGFDVLLTRVGDAYVVESRTEAGDALLALAPDLQEADPVSLGRREQVWEDAQKLLRRQVLKCDLKELPAVLERAQEHPIWEKKARTCFSCGACVTVCPTCFCFDVQDELDSDLQGAARVRQWDACVLSGFALVAGGHNFRKRREERYRHRFYRKAKYLPERFGFAGCVGCGRCISACMAGIANPVEIYNTLLEGAS